MENFLDEYGYLALMIGTFLEGETVILIASSLIHQGYFGFTGTVFFAFLGSFISDWLYYIIGRANGRFFIDKRPRLQEKLRIVQKFYNTHKILILISYRFLYGFRVIIPLMIGVNNTNALEYLFYSIVCGLAWASVVTVSGYLIGLFLNLNAQSVEENLVLIILGFGTFGLLVGYTIKRLVFKV